MVGNICSTVANVLPGMQAAFVDIGMEKNAFLYVDDVFSDLSEEDSPSSSCNQHRGMPIEKLLKVGEEIMVQVIKEPFGSKGTRVTCSVTLPGRYLVLVPGADHVGVSRRIENPAERERLRQDVGKLKLDNHVLIIRTVADGAAGKCCKRSSLLLQLCSGFPAGFSKEARL